MSTNPLRLSLLALVLCSAGCDLDDDKRSCELQADCLAGFRCEDRVCIDIDGPGGNGNGGDDSDDDTGTPGQDSGGDGSEMPASFFGDVLPLTSASASTTALPEGNTLVAATSAPGTLGCATTSDLRASPGPDVAVVYAMVNPEAGDRRCPTGVYAIMDDPDTCTPRPGSQLREGCALYKRWDNAGELAAYQLATSGYVSITEARVADTVTRCTGELRLGFAGGIVIERTWMTEYDPFTAGASVCAH